MDYKIVLMRDAEEDLDRFITYLLFEKKSEQAARNLSKKQAEVNGALNIMRKSRVVDVNILYSRGEVDTPIRIRIA